MIDKSRVKHVDYVHVLKILIFNQLFNQLHQLWFLKLLLKLLKMTTSVKFLAKTLGRLDLEVQQGVLGGNIAEVMTQLHPELVSDLSIN